MEIEFWEWITKKYIEWRGNKVGNEGSTTKFAKYLGVKRPTVTQWMKRDGKRPEKIENIIALVNAFGFEAYQYLKLPTPVTYTYKLDSLVPLSNTIQESLAPPRINPKLLDALAHISPAEQQEILNHLKQSQSRKIKPARTA
jgi:hypothetical protein